MKESTSSGVGGSPVRSIESRLMRTARSASGEGDIPSASSLESTKRSMGFRTQPSPSTAGTGGRSGATKAQWGA